MTSGFIAGLVQRKKITKLIATNFMNSMGSIRRVDKELACSARWLTMVQAIV